jgi:nucleotide-binding universal stress UspA family protein
VNLPVDIVVVPVDFSAMSLDAIEQARPLVKSAGGLHVVHVLPPMLATEPGVLWGRVDDASRTEHATQALRKAVADKGFADVPVHVRVSASGNAASEIAAFAEELRAQLIVLPSHGRHGLSRLAIGSVAERVVRFAHCPVLVLRT